MHGYYYEPFTFPFIIGVIFLFAKIWTRFFSWISALPKADRRQIIKNCISKHTFIALWEAFCEILIHRRMFKINKLLWYMHFSLAFGWFLMIVVAKLQVATYLKNPVNPPYVEIFFERYFPFYENVVFDFILDLLLLFVLSGLVLAIYKRKNTEKFGITKNVKHYFIDKVALYSLWMVFPMRLMAESINGSVYGSGGFLTGTLGDLFSNIFPFWILYHANNIVWWLYSITMAVFLIALPFSRYLHIFAEIPLVFLRNFGVKAAKRPTTFTFLESAACSRCGVCVDVCPLVKNGMGEQSNPLDFIRNVRKRRRVVSVVDDCLMCGECERICPVKIEHQTIRLGERYLVRHNDTKHDFKFLPVDNIKKNEDGAKIGYFAGCASHLDPSIIASMQAIFTKTGDEFIFIDKDGGVCCGESLESAGYIGSADRLTKILIDKIDRSGVDTLVVNCPSCYKRLTQFKMHAKVMLHSQYIYDCMNVGRLDNIAADRQYAFFEPCAVRNGDVSSEFAEKVISKKGILKPFDQETGCCGGSLHNNYISQEGRKKITNSQTNITNLLELDCVITMCPRCKNALKTSSRNTVKDISELFL